jgi:hypothetical protein
MAAEPLRCYSCGALLSRLSLPLGRLDACPDCSRPLHACRMCRSYDTQAIDACTEEDAVAVRDKKSANFCDYFKPNPQAYRPDEHRSALQAAAALDSLFGTSADTVSAARTDEEDPALAAARALFGDDRSGN